MKIYKSKQHTKKAGMLALAALIGAGTIASLAPPVSAQPDAGTAKAINPPNRKKGGRGARKGNGMGKKMVEREMTRIEQVNGKPLTEEQKTKVRDALAERVKATRQAQQDYLKAVADATGVTVDELQMKLRAQRRRKNGGATPNAPAAPGGAG